ASPATAVRRSLGTRSGRGRMQGPGPDSVLWSRPDTVRSGQDTEPIGNRVATPALPPTSNGVSRRPPGAHSADTRAPRAPGRQPVTYVDRTLTCVDCGVEFIHSAADQEFY